MIEFVRLSVWLWAGGRAHRSTKLTQNEYAGVELEGRAGHILDTPTSDLRSAFRGAGGRF